MFTGIITDIGVITDIIHDTDMTITLQTHFDISTIDIGASIACNGICLTVTTKDYDHQHISFCLSNETLNNTTAKNWVIGQKINLERALKMGDELGGHLVTGHIDEVATIDSITPDARSFDIKIAAPSEVMAFIAPKGSICCDGISLTVNKVYDRFFHVNIIPHTQQVTNWQNLNKNDSINLEIDMMARYMARYLDVKQK
ncbi:MAG: riboflavin synthase [Alphaproteobacteria bacterium]|jgi:riboflavin synthase